MLEKLSDSLKSTLKKIANSIFIDKRLIDDLVKDIQRSLLQADVNVSLVFELSNKIKKRALEEKPSANVEQKNHLVNIVYEELVNFVGGEKKEIKIDLSNDDLPAIRCVCPEYEPETKEYEALGGLVIMGLTQNHLDLFLQDEDGYGPACPWLEKYRFAENCIKPKLVITHIVGGSCAEQTDQLLSGFIITKINDEKVKTLKEFRAVVLKGKESGFIKIETENEHRVILSIDDILAQEDAISECAYPPSPLVQQLKSK